MSGPACECCDVRFTGDAQLAEHKQGRRHCIAQAAFDAPSAPTLVVECRHGPIEQAALNAAFSPHGVIGKIELHASDPSGKPSRPVRNGKEGPWFATIVYRESRAGQVLGPEVHGGERDESAGRAGGWGVVQCWFCFSLKSIQNIRSGSIIRPRDAFRPSIFLAHASPPSILPEPRRP